MSTQAVGLVGLGNMGAAVAQRLVAAGPLKGFDLDADRRADAAARGVEIVDDLAGFAGCDVVVLSLPSPSISASVVGRLRDVIAPGATIIETSTVNPHDMAALAAILDGSGVRLVDAAILSGVGVMAKGDAILLTGGSAEDLAEVRSVLDAMSARIIPFGDLGAGMAAKVINNAVAHAVMVVLCEAVALAEANGIGLQAISELLADPDAGLTRPLTHRIMERVASGDYEGGMPTDAARKDSTLVLELAQAGKVPLFAIQASHTVYELAMAEGLARKDYAAIATLWPQLAPPASQR
ncbi:3-hydroxyisobutyrate dehydrogenase [soil metagenome]